MRDAERRGGRGTSWGQIAPVSSVEPSSTTTISPRCGQGRGSGERPESAGLVVGGITMDMTSRHGILPGGGVVKGRTSRDVSHAPAVGVPSSRTSSRPPRAGVRGDPATPRPFPAGGKSADPRGW